MSEKENKQCSTLEREEMTVYVKFENQREDYSADDMNNFRLIGIDTNEPILSLGNKVFGGSWKHLPTTAMFFEETSEQNHEYPNRTVKYMDKTRKVLKVKPVFLSPKDAINRSIKDETDIEVPTASQS